MDRDPSRDVLVAGETLIDFIPERPGPLEDVAGFERRAGGAPANVAVGLATLGAPPLFWTRVGDDPFGRYLEGVLADYGIPDAFVERDPAAKTTLAFVTHDAAGDRAFTFYRDGTADTRLEPGRIDDETLEALEWVHAGGVTLATGRSREATLDLLERATAAGCTVSFDPNARAELWPDDETFARICRDALAHVDVCKATVAELEALGFAGETPRDVARSVLADAADESGPHTALVTRGDEGAVVATAARAPWHDGGADVALAEHSGFAVDAVDTTGAGDAFVAGSISALREGRSIDSTLAFANAVAATATTETGAMAALPSREEVASLLEDD
ncbi:carbohydrate kinase family protein [Halopiger goleimassiliensis]|uniref:carbohydrate kinase family protein n=1 Tax=Halopiger goleimassiliensis TaxID=1293048 RepID=UPI0006780AE3|nr:carbohydrate kinase [Halopiger goleimassiliensis]